MMEGGVCLHTKVNKSYSLGHVRLLCPSSLQVPRRLVSEEVSSSGGTGSSGAGVVARPGFGTLDFGHATSLSSYGQKGQTDTIYGQHSRGLVCEATPCIGRPGALNIYPLFSRIRVLFHNHEPKVVIFFLYQELLKVWCKVVSPIVT